MNIQKLLVELQKAHPVSGINSAGVVSFLSSATPQQRAAVTPAAIAGAALIAARVDAAERIDQAAETTRLRYITGGAGQAATYLLKDRQARAYADGGYNGAVPGLVQSEATARGIAAATACDTIIAESNAWAGLAAQIETVRRKAKVSIAAAVDLETIAGTTDAALALLAEA